MRLTAQQGVGMTSRRTRERLIQRLEEAGIRNPEVLDVMRRLPRHLFVDEALASHAYTRSAPGAGQPRYRVGDRYRLGFQTAVLAALVRWVYSIERVSLLSERARRTLRKLKLRNVRLRLRLRLRHGDGTLGWPEYAPFGAILVTAAPVGIPRVLVNQLTMEDCMVLPIRRPEQQVLVRVVRTETGYVHEILEPVTFVPLLGGVT